MTEHDSDSSQRHESEPALGAEPIRSEPAGPESSRRKSSSGAVLRYATLGTELAAFTLSCTAVGYFLDGYVFRQLDQRIATAIGTLIGFVLGMVRFMYVVNRDQN